MAIALIIAGCGGGSDKPTAKPTATLKSTGKAKPVTKPTVAPPSGTPIPEALSRFRCEPDTKGQWNASGYVANASKTKVTFQITVYVGAAAGGAEKAMTKQVPNVAPGGSVQFAIAKIPAPKAGGPCYVQVLSGR